MGNLWINLVCGGRVLLFCGQPWVKTLPLVHSAHLFHLRPQDPWPAPPVNPHLKTSRPLVNLPLSPVSTAPTTTTTSTFYWSYKPTLVIDLWITLMDSYPHRSRPSTSDLYARLTHWAPYPRVTRFRCLKHRCLNWRRS